MYPSSNDIAKYDAQRYADAMNATPYQYSSTSGSPTKWSTGLCHCCFDPAKCLITCVCPCVTFGQIAEIVNKDSTPCASSGAVYGLLLALTGLSCLHSCFYRSKLRAQNDLEVACSDCLNHFCCE